jgi:hypothetical protein
MAFSETYENYVITNDVGNLSALLKIKPERGKTPTILSGHYTSVVKARAAIDEYKRGARPVIKKPEAKKEDG